MNKTVIASALCLLSLGFNLCASTEPVSEEKSREDFSRTTVVGFPQDWHLMDFDNDPFMKAVLEGALDHERGVIRYHPGMSVGFTPEEARTTFKGPLHRLLGESEIPAQDWNGLEEAIFSSKYFEPISSQTPASSQGMEKEDMFELLSDDPYLRAAIANTISNHEKGRPELDIIQKQKDCINPAVFLLPADMVCEWFFTKARTYHKMKPQRFQDLAQYAPEQLFPQIFSNHCNFPTDPEAQNAYYLANAIGFMDQEIVSQHLMAARAVAAQVNPQDRIVIFGNTPYFLGRALDALHERGQCAVKPIYLPFSGAPNTFSSRNMGQALGDVVTPERYAHFQGFLQKKGLMDQAMLTGTTHIVDVIGSGAGPAYTMGTILNHFAPQVPQFNIFSMNEFSCEEPRHTLITSHMAKNGERTALSFPNQESAYFRVPAQVVHVKDHTLLDFMPDKCASLRVVPKNKPAFWNDAYKDMFDAPLGIVAQHLLKHFDVNLKHLMSHEGNA
ncbi:MAG: hypothetical protein LCH26_03715 [Proteobacteria bacterium]|nr:hypothetical protein [Pseudomonadota bacterium]